VFMRVCQPVHGQEAVVAGDCCDWLFTISSQNHIRPGHTSPTCCQHTAESNQLKSITAI